MTITNFMLFLSSSWLLIITPGPDLIYVLTRGIGQGKKAGLVSALGVTSGLLVHTLFAALGLAVVLRTSAVAFTIVKTAGAVYLIYLGIKTLLDKGQLELSENKAHVKTRDLYVQGIVSNVFNPKVALFFMAFLPQFLDSSNGVPAGAMVGLGLLFSFCGLIFLATVGYFAGYVGRWLATRQTIARRVQWGTGAVLMLLGVRLAFLKRK